MHTWAELLEGKRHMEPVSTSAHSQVKRGQKEKESAPKNTLLKETQTRRGVVLNVPVHAARTSSQDPAYCKRASRTSCLVSGRATPITPAAGALTTPRCHIPPPPDSGRDPAGQKLTPPSAERERKSAKTIRLPGLWITL
ncbi:hypothetical protein NQZ68_000850 [Dissostichus eleginoides]|nr:hypothetical protein NQZ68_000850 [Dissostichus eleginoides]